MVRRATVIGGGRLTIAGPLRGQRVDMTLTGSGSLAVPGIEADLLFVTLLGSGDIALAGKAAKVNLNTSGPGTIAAARLTAGDLVLRLDGNGETQATALYTANVTTTGIGAATVYGKPSCTVKAVAGGPISCGQLPGALKLQEQSEARELCPSTTRASHRPPPCRRRDRLAHRRLRDSASPDARASGGHG